MNLTLNHSEGESATDETTGYGKVVGPEGYEPSILRDKPLNLELLVLGDKLARWLKGTKNDWIDHLGRDCTHITSHSNYGRSYIING